jgi:hypothetical protein
MCVWVQHRTSAECIIHSNGPCPRYRTGYGVNTSTSELPARYGGLLWVLPLICTR